MAWIGLALLGVFFGAAGSEILRKHKPELVKKVEDSARIFVDSFLDAKSGSKGKTGDE